MHEVEIKKTPKTNNQYNLKITGWTAVMIMATRNALELYENHSAVASDCLDFLNHAIDNNPELKAKIN